MWQHFTILFNLSSSGKRSRAALKVLNGKTRSVIDKRRLEIDEDLQNSKPTTDNHDEIGHKKRYAFLDSLLRAQRDGADLSDKMIEDEVNTFMFEVSCILFWGLLTNTVLICFRVMIRSALLYRLQFMNYQGIRNIKLEHETRYLKRTETLIKCYFWRHL